MLTLKNPKKTEEESSEKRLFTRGYSDIRNRLSKNSRFTQSCYNCEYYYQTAMDKEEVCQNPDVLKYDMVITESNIYCNRWKLCSRTSSIKSIFKKGK